jgi:hypothetical protein
LSAIVLYGLLMTYVAAQEAKKAATGVLPPVAVGQCVDHLKTTMAAADWPYQLFLYRNGMTDAKWQAFLTAIALHVNAISRYSEFIRPTVVSPDVLRIDIRDPKWDAKVRELLADADPYYHVTQEKAEYKLVEEKVIEKWGGGIDPKDGKYYAPGNYETGEVKKVSKKVVSQKIRSASFVLLSDEEHATVIKNLKDPEAFYKALALTQIGQLLAMTKSAAPFVRADWFLVQGARQLSLSNQQTGVGYYDWLGIKKRDDYFKLIKFSEKDSIDIGREVRAVVKRSGVSQQNRQIERDQALTGGEWYTLDVDDPTGRGNATVQLKKGDYKHKAEEHYGFLPNGLEVNILCQADGTLQATAPDFIGGDDSPFRLGRDFRIHVNKSCKDCHYQDVLKPINDWARRTFRLPQLLNAAADKDQQLDFARQYFSNLDLHLRNDRRAYWQAYARLSGAGLENADDRQLRAETGRIMKAYLDAYNDYVETSLALEDVAREHYTTPEKLTRSLLAIRNTTQVLNPGLAGLVADPPDTLERVHHEELYALVEVHLRGAFPNP